MRTLAVGLGVAECYMHRQLINIFSSRALTMPEDERILRMNYLRRREKLNDVNYWTRSFLSAMGSLITQEDHDDIGAITMPAVTLDDFDEYLAK